MSFAQTFNIGYLKTRAERGEEVFLSVTEGFECGPGIIRDGVSLPRMEDPHLNVSALGEMYPDEWSVLPPTTNPYVQRAGTWTLFHHLYKFIAEHGERYQVIGVESCGDLTMNPWHVALIHRKIGPVLCRVPEERFTERTYRCLVKWRTDLDFPWQYDFMDLRFAEVNYSAHARIFDSEYLKSAYGGKSKEDWLREKGVNLNNIAPSVEFALAGKPIIQKRSEIPLDNVIDRFQDVRHIFNLPTVPAKGRFGTVDVTSINFGEHELYNFVNSRRAALQSPVIVPLQLSGVSVEWPKLDAALIDELFKASPETPTKRGQYRKYSAQSVEIFFPYNVYPFGVLGGKSGELVCLASGGLSGRIGNTLPGVTTIMYDFFGCEEALVLDEGLDTFHIVNPGKEIRDSEFVGYEYSNEEILNEVAAFTLERFEEDRDLCFKEIQKKKEFPYFRGGERKPIEEFGEDMALWPLNAVLAKELQNYCETNNCSKKKTYKTIAVGPHRSQMRAVLIFAVRREPTA